MSIADEKYKELILDIHKNGSWDKDGEVRTRYANGTPAYTKSVFGRQVVFEEGEIPLLTTKHVGWKTAFKELRLFWILQSVKKEDFVKDNVKIWDEWFLEDNTLGKSYAYQFESRPVDGNILKIKRKTKKKPDSLDTIVIGNKIEPNLHNKDELIGKKFFNDRGQQYTVVDVYKTGTHYPKSKSAKIQFEKTNSTLILQYGDAKRANCRDRYERSVYGVGYIGNIDVADYEDIRKYKDIWNSIMARCYDKDSTRYKDYGEKGIFVDDRWHCFENFLKDIKTLPQWFLKKQSNDKKYHLDKDYYGSNCYSKDTCVWLSNSDNVLYSGEKGKPFDVYKNGDFVKTHISTVDASREFNIEHSIISRILKGERNDHKGYTFRYKTLDDDYVYRYEISKNQVVDLINNIKYNPMSRRLMTSFWNYKDVSDKALQECAMQTTWNVRDGKLDLLLYSRSVDAPLGLPFNWIQYWFLLQMVAHVTGYKPGKFIHQMGNVHYYDAHEETILNQINSETYDQPEFKLNENVESFFDFTLEDIEIVNYQHGGKFTYQVAI